MTSPLLAVALAAGCFDPQSGELTTEASSTSTTDGSTSAPPPGDATTGTTAEPGETTVSVDDTSPPATDSGSTSESGDDDVTAGSASSGSTDDGTTEATTGEGECGNGIVEGAEACDDANANDVDACTNACALGSIRVAGYASMYLASALGSLGEAFVTERVEWATPGTDGVIIMGHDGASPVAPDYQPFLDAGGHVLVVGGAGDPAYAAWANPFITNTGEFEWHQSSGCASDWNTVGAHPMTALLPATYEFLDQSLSYHMVHFTAAGQPPGTELLGQSCEPGPDNYVLATRRYPSGGTFTYMALDLGPYSDAASEAGFTAPLLQGYLAYVRSPAP